VLALAGCAGRGEDVQRATQGPTADEIYMARFLGDYGRLPTFDETSAFRARPELSTSPRASQFTFARRIAVGMTREQVALLGGAPARVSRDAAQMAEMARQFWPAVSARAEEMWVYPGGWCLYFDGERPVDLTVAGRPPL
jgi:hypothetical protein